MGAHASLGQDHVLRPVTAALSAASEGSGGLVLLLGDAGIGKTTAETLAREGYRVFGTSRKVKDGGPTGVETSGPGPGDPQADNTAKIKTAIPEISNRREGFILSSKKRASSTYPNRQRGL